jgi:hypothetical protein
VSGNKERLALQPTPPCSAYVGADGSTVGRLSARRLALPLAATVAGRGPTLTLLLPSGRLLLLVS